jgi:hypothetical protein
VPLNTSRNIDIFGGAPVAGRRTFSVTASLGGTTLPRAPHMAPFAPAQFFALNDDEKLAAPAFETLEAGSVFGEAGVSFDAAQVIAGPLEYQEVRITLGGPPPTVPADAEPAPQTLTAADVQTFARSGAAGRAPVRHVGRARFRNDAVEGAAEFAPARWRVVPIGDAPPVTVDPGVTTWSEYQGVAKALNRGKTRYQVVPAHELED